MADVGTGYMDILPRVSSALFSRSLTGQVTAGVAAAKGPLAKLGQQLGTIVGSPVGALAGAAVIGAVGRLTISFEDAFTRIASLSNASAADVAAWRDQVLTLSGETAQAPQDLADALYFLASAGLETSQVMPVLEASAQGAAVGLGDVSTVARITANALNAYAGSGLQASEVTDTLVAAVREGSVEPDEFADSLGRILPIAEQAGVSFQDVAASIASLTNIGLNAFEAVTAMRGALQAIAAPGTLAAKAMDSVGLSAQDLLDAISEGGLYGALGVLDDAIKANTDTQAEYIGTFRAIIPNVRALTGVLGLTGQEASKVQAIFDNVSESTGSLARALEITAGGPGFQMRQLMAELQELAIRVGTSLLPLATDLADAFIAISPVLEDVANHAKELAIAFGLVYGFSKLPSLLTAVGTALTSLGATQAGTAMTGLATSMSAVATVAGAALLPALALLATAYIAHVQHIAQLKSELDAIATDTSFGTWAGTTIGAMDDATSAFITGQLALDLIRQKAEAAGYEGFDPLQAAIGSVISALRAGNIDVNEAEAALQAFGLTTAEADLAVGAAVPTLGEFADATNRTGEEAATAAGRLQEYKEALLDLAGGIIGIVHAQQDVRSAQAEVNRLLNNGKQGTREYVDAQLALLEAQASLEGKLADEAQAMRDAGATTADVRARLHQLAAAAGLTDAQFKQLWERTNGLKDGLDALPRNVRVTLNADGDAEATVTRLKAGLNEINGNVYTVDINGNFHRIGQSEGGILPGFAEGGLIRGAGGFVARGPTYLVGEGSYATPAGRGAEAVIPLNARGRRFVQEAWGMDDEHRARGPMVIAGELTLSESSRAYIRGIIREEVDGAYVDRRLARELARRGS